jgi:hypothetical protein
LYLLWRGREEKEEWEERKGLKILERVRVKDDCSTDAGDPAGAGDVRKLCKKILGE